MPDHLHGNAPPPRPEMTDEKRHAPATDAGSAAPSSGDGKEDKPDRFGEELAGDAHVWRVYGKVAKEEDKERVQRWNGGLNNLALFAALFSGITTTFIIESQHDLKPDFAELAYRVQNATAHGRAYVEEPFVIPLRARVVNCLWLASLLLSLSAALIAIMGQDWIEMFVDRPVCNLRQWAEIRTFRMAGLEKWYMPGVIATAPVLLHSSLFLFGAGLIVFMDADTATRNLCIALCATTAWLYAVTMFSPVLWSSSPFRSPATVLMRHWFCAMFRPGGDAQDRLAQSTSGPSLPARPASGSSATPTTSPISDSATTLPAVDTDVLTLPAGGHGGTGQTLGAAATRLAGMQSFPPGPSAPIPEEVASEPYDAEKAEPQPISRRSTLRSRAPKWFQELYSKFMATVTRLVELCAPDFTNEWTDIPTEPSPLRVAQSLSWLYTASSSPDVLRAVVTALGDLSLGPKLGKPKASETSQRLFNKIRAAFDANVDQLNLQEMARYVLVRRNLGHSERPSHLMKRFGQAIARIVAGADEQFSEDELLAVLYLSNPSGIASPATRWHIGGQRLSPPTLQPLCLRIQACSSITLPAIVSMLPLVSDESLNAPTRPGFFSLPNLIVIMNRWRDSLPNDLRFIETFLESGLDDASKERKNGLMTYCQCGPGAEKSGAQLAQPVDNILHLLIALLPRLTRFPTTTQAAVDLIIYLAHTTSSINASEANCMHHPCLAEVFGSDNPAVLKAVWERRHAMDVQSALRRIGIVGNPPMDFCAEDLRPLQPDLARTLVRHMSPPFNLIGDQVVFKNHRLPRGDLLYDLVKAMGAEAPPDLFRRVLEQAALADVARFNRQFWYVLAAVATWIGERAASSDGPELFGLFVSSPGPDENSPAWNLAEAVSDAMAHLDEERRCFDNNGQKRNGNSATNPPHPAWNAANGVHNPANKRTPGEGTSENPREDCLTVALHFLGALERVRTAFPDSALWADIARSVGMKSERCPKLMWLNWREAVHRATGIDPSPFAAGGTSNSASVPSESTMNIEVTQHSSVHDRTVVVAGISSSDSSLTIPPKAAAAEELRIDVAIGPAAETAAGQRQPRFMSSHRAMHAPP